MARGAWGGLSYSRVEHVHTRQLGYIDVWRARTTRRKLLVMWGTAPCIGRREVYSITAKARRQWEAGGSRRRQGGRVIARAAEYQRRTCGPRSTISSPQTRSIRPSLPEAFYRSFSPSPSSSGRGRLKGCGGVETSEEGRQVDRASSGWRDGTRLDVSLCILSESNPLYTPKRQEVIGAHHEGSCLGKFPLRVPTSLSPLRPRRRPVVGSGYLSATKQRKRRTPA